ncbi:MAG: AbrB family transcriptional regulator [Lacrimispora sp.]|uniref:AbrB family transcriptional regulator n=1 Tax=Lacrimispora sp. TaxID=2719234 RepID=UPI0039E4F7B3
MEIIKLLLTLAAAFLAGSAFLRMKVPGGMLVGGIVGSAALGIIFQASYVPGAGKVFAQIVAGAFIGSGVKKSELKQIPRILRPAVLLLSFYMAANIGMGLLIHAASPVDIVTAFFSAVPGGISDIPIIAADMGANAPQVAALQFVRLVIGIGIFPGMINRFCKKEEPVSKTEEDTVSKSQTAGSGEEKKPYHALITFLIASICGVVGKMSGIPAGTLVFSLVSVIALKIFWGKAYLPAGVKRFAQLVSGAYIGCSLGWKDLLELRYLAVPAIILILGYSAFCFLMGEILKRFCGMSRKEAMLAATPAGASDMALISSDIGVQSTDLVLLQVLRLIIVTAIFPQVLHLILFTL